MKQVYLLLFITILSVLVSECTYYLKECKKTNCTIDHDSINNLKK